MQIQAAERRKPKDERELINRYKVFAKLQTAMDFEVLIEGLVCESRSSDPSASATRPGRDVHACCLCCTVDQLELIVQTSKFCGAE